MGSEDLVQGCGAGRVARRKLGSHVIQQIKRFVIDLLFRDDKYLIEIPLDRSFYRPFALNMLQVQNARDDQGGCRQGNRKLQGEQHSRSRVPLLLDLHLTPGLIALGVCNIVDRHLSSVNRQ